jgi:hypothetical protein
MSDFQENRGSEMFRLLDEHLVESADSPDQALDWVFMLEEEDWTFLQQIWSDRTAEWREALAYVIGGPIQESQRLLRFALYDTNRAVAWQAACTLAWQATKRTDGVELSPNELARFKELAILQCRPLPEDVRRLLERC